MDTLERIFLTYPYPEILLSTYDLRHWHIATSVKAHQEAHVYLDKFLRKVLVPQGKAAKRCPSDVPPI